MRSEGSNGRPGLPHERLAHPTLVRLSDEAGLGAEHAARKRIVASLPGERVEPGSASGSFNCLMAGRSKLVLGDFDLSHIMKVQATPTTGAISGSIATFSGPGFVIMDGGQRANINVSVWVDVATQQFQLTVLDLAPDPIALETETFSSGGVRLR